MKNINDIVAGLSEEEKSLHRELIDECRNREEFLLHCRKETQENIEKLTKITANIAINLRKFHDLSMVLKEAYKTSGNDILKNVLAMMPEEYFYRA